LQEVPLVQIDLDEAAMELVPAPDLDRLKISLQEVGMLNPPWLRPQPGGRPWQVVTGTRRLGAAADLGWREISARLLPQGTPDFYCLLVHLVDNAYTRGFNLWEQATLATRLLAHCDQETIAAKYLPYLGLPPSPAFLARLLKAATLKPPWPRLAAQGRLALTAAAQLSDWDPQDQAAAWPYLANLRLSQSKQEEFLEQVALLARREGVSAAAVLARDVLRVALVDPDRTPQERAEAVRRQMYRWFYPRLSAAQEAFETTLGKLGWKGNRRFRLQAPAAFEGPDFHLEIKFRDAPELQHLLTEIARLTRREDFAGLTRY
jgi:ParB-like chromosome segregation protein Spo0J